MSYALQVVRPTVMTPAQIVSTNVPETDAPAYAPATTYALGNQVIYANAVYESASAGNIGRQPDTNPAHWIRLGPTNRWRVFDRSFSSQTAQASSIVYELLTDELCTAFAALNVTGATALALTITHPTFGVVYTRSFDLTLVPAESGWWGWWFSERRAPSQSLATDLPSFPGSTVRVELTGGADLAVGVILLGQVNEFGLGVKSGARVGIDDYSRKERNGFGDLELVERAFNRRANFDLAMEWTDVDRILEFCAENRARPCLWIGSERYEATTVYGTYASFDVVINYHDYADCQLELKGLT